MAMSDLPARCPVRPLGRNGDTYHFLSAAGQDVKYTAAQLGKNETLISLFTHGEIDAVDWLRQLGPPRRTRRGSDTTFNALDAATRLMAACAALPLFDPDTEVRKFGTWRGEGGAPVIHAGERILHPSGIKDPAGQMIGGAIYPATQIYAEPADEAATVSEIEDLRARLREGWTWARPQDADIVLGWIGQACLGAFPEWRTHLWISGRRGTGKSTLVRIITKLLGGMSTGVKKGSTEAAVRARTNQMAITRVFDEAEGEGEAGKVEGLIELFRLMSDPDGAKIERGTVDQTGVSFRLHGAGLMASIIPGIMSPADRSRWVMIDLSPRASFEDARAEARALARLEEVAEHLGPRIWRRMFDLALSRWDRAFLEHSAVVQGMGGDARDGATIGAILTGWDLLMSDHAGEPDTTEAARWISEPLVEDARAAEEEGEGERCLRTILAFMVPRDHGGTISINEIVRRNSFSEPDAGDRSLLGRVGLRLMGAGTDAAALFVHGPAHPTLDRAFASTRWRAGGHRRALLMLDGVRPSETPVRVAGNKVRGVLVPKQYLPTHKD